MRGRVLFCGLLSLDGWNRVPVGVPRADSPVRLTVSLFASTQTGPGPAGCVLGGLSSSSPAGARGGPVLGAPRLLCLVPSPGKRQAFEHKLQLGLVCAQSEVLQFTIPTSPGSVSMSRVL